MYTFIYCIIFNILLYLLYFKFTTWLIRSENCRLINKSKIIKLYEFLEKFLIKKFHENFLIFLDAKEICGRSRFSMFFQTSYVYFTRQKTCYRICKDESFKYVNWNVNSVMYYLTAYSPISVSTMLLVTYATRIMINDETMASGILFFGFVASSPVVAIMSKPMKA